MSAMLRVLVRDESRTRAGYQVAAILPDAANLAHQVEQLQPDIILIESEAPSRDTLEHLAVVNEHMPRPVVMFTQDGAGEMIREAVRVGVSAYVVDGLDAKRIKPVIEVARDVLDMASLFS
jgi:two-component system, response regulator / RNA-binding antiterminator